MTPDLINGTFELIGGLLLFMHSRRVLKDKEVKGVSVPPMLFFLGWGLWNLFYYPHLDQWFSFLGGCVILAGNLTWVALVAHYKGWGGKLRCRLGLHRWYGPIMRLKMYHQPERGHHCLRPGCTAFRRHEHDR